MACTLGTVKRQNSKETSISGVSHVELGPMCRRNKDEAEVDSVTSQIAQGRGRIQHGG
jgi:hypothetical protein